MNLGIKKCVAMSQNESSCGPDRPLKIFNIEKYVKDTNLIVFAKE